MPGGLSGVEQTFTADASGYISEIQAMIKANQGLVQSVAEAKRAVGDAGKAPGGSGADDIAKVNQAIREQLRVLGDHSRAVRDVSVAVTEMGRAHAQTADVTSGHADAVSDLTDSYESARASAVEMARAQQTANDAAMVLIRSHLQGNKILEDGSSAARSYATDLGAVRDTAKDTTSALADTAAAVSAIKVASSGGGGSAAGPSLTEIGRMMDQRIKAEGFSSYRNAVAAAGLGPSGGGSGAGWDTATAVAAMSAASGIGAAAGGGGGGGGRGRWTSGAYAASGGGDMFPVGSAGHDASVITGFVKRWWTPVHFAVMTANEMLATLLPATAAAGAATLVGWQGVEQMIPRIQAINNTAEALGGAYGVTSGSYLGTGSAIQRYQNLAGGGVYELGGAGINLMRSGAGSFGQTGLSTIAMLDRGVADMQTNMQQRGTMGELGGLAGKGTDYLRQLGDIGANFGNIFLGLAPHLPGVGDDYLSLLEGVTGGLGGGIGLLNQSGLGNLLGAGMAGEAGWRVGKPVVGLAGKGLMGLGNLAGKIGLGGSGLAEGDIADIAALTGMDLGEGAIGLGGGGLAGLLTGAGAGLGMMTGPMVGGLALSAFLGSKLISSMPGRAQRQVGGLQTGINQAGFTGAWEPLAKAITTVTGLGQGTGGGLGSGMVGASEAPSTFARFGPIGQTSQQVYQAAAATFTGQLGDLVGAGPQLVADLKKAGLKSVSMGDAFQIAQNSLLDLSHAFDKHGNLTKQAQQMLTNYVSAIGPMTRSGGAFNAAIGAQQVMSSPAMQDLSKVNQAMDSMTQIMTGGPAGMAQLFGMLGGAHAPGKTPPAMSQMAKALTSFTTPGGAAAWTKFAGPSGLITAEQQNLDQLRTGLTLGAIQPGGAAGLAGFQLQQMLPMAGKSPAALAMLMQQGQQMGIGGYYDQSKSFAQNLKDAQSSFAKIADTSKQANAATGDMAVKLSNIPAVAKQFVQGTGAQIQAQQVAKAAQDAVAIKGGVNVKANVSDLVSQLKAAGVQGGAALKSSLDAVLTQAGVGKAQRIKIEADVSKAQSQINGVHGKNVDINIMTKGAQAAQAEMDAIHGKTVTVTIVQRVIQQVITSGAAAAAASGIPSFSLPGGPAGMRIHAQTGGMVPGSGSGDIIPAMLEPGEAIIPRYLVPLIAPILASHRVPGFGGVPQSSSSHFAAGGLVPHVLGFPDPTTEQGKSGQLTWSLIDGITKALNSGGAKKIADALMTQIGKEVALAKNVSSAAMQGQGFGNSGIFGGMDVTPGTGNGTVMEQMQSYLSSVQSFTKDIGTLRKDHLNKNIISQLVGAGPVQGDALAQSILNDYGGVKGVNQVWGQLGKATKGLGNEAELAQYGGLKASNTSVSININAGAGGAAGLNLTTAQIKQIVAQVQAALLKQAKRNPKTGIQLSGKGA